MSKLEIVKSLEKEFNYELLSGFQYYEAIKNNRRLKAKMDLERWYAIKAISASWGIPMEMAEEFYEAGRNQ